MDHRGPPAGSPAGDPAGPGRAGQGTRPLARPPRHRRPTSCPPRTLPRPARYVPHIYTDRELADLFAQTDRCRYSAEVPFRHLRTWFAAGEDIGALLPVLQAYMGHSSISDTAYYLRLTAESYPQIAARVRREYGDIVPPVTGGTGHGD